MKASYEPTLAGPSLRGKRYILNLQGYAAAQGGAPFTFNPYEAGTMESVGWYEGWSKGHLNLPIWADSSPVAP